MHRPSAAPQYWELDPPGDALAFLRSLPVIAPVSAVLYFEEVSEDFSFCLRNLALDSREKFEYGALWPKAAVYHVPTNALKDKKFLSSAEVHAATGLCTHFHVYTNKTILLEWYDAFNDHELWIDASVEEEKIREFSVRNGVRYRLVDHEC